MILNKQELISYQNETGFRPEVFEKVVLLVGLLQEINKHEYLKTRFVLKGGTAKSFLFMSS
jgi:hypothetical protein